MLVGRAGQSCLVRKDMSVEGRLSLQKCIILFCFVAGMGVTVVKVIARWSDMEVLVLKSSTGMCQWSRQGQECGLGCCVAL